MRRMFARRIAKGIYDEVGDGAEARSLPGSWMKLAGSLKVTMVLLGVAWVLLWPRTGRTQEGAGQQGGAAAVPMTTHEHLDSEPWWPTETSSALQSYAGSEACSGCHTSESAVSTSMARAGVLAKDATFLHDKAALSYASKPLIFSLSASGGGIDYAVANGAHRVSHRLDWIMGAGDMGRTFLYQVDGRWYQSELSVYTREGKLDTTTGLERDPAASLEAALGQPLSAADARTCFGCHSVHSTTSSGFNPAHAEAGLGCEACHGPAHEHVSKMGDASKAVHAETAVFNPAKLSPAASIDFCGACHRTFADTQLTTARAMSTAIVRFQPYRLEESKCWRSTMDERLTCVACHNPHEPLNRNVASYDKHCLQCHAGVGSADQHAGKVCPKATSQCTTCHMPKVAIESMHGDFSDHFIRVVKPGEGFPQ